MRIDILTLFPEMFTPLKTSIIGKAVDKGLVELNILNIRDYAKNKHKTVDDTPFGGGNGMLMMCQPIYDAIQSVKTENSIVIYMSPKGRTLTQNYVKEYSKKEHLILLCGHYEGIDERLFDLCIDEELSIGDYVLTGGELPAMVFVDCVLRYVPNVLHNANSTEDESFSSNLLEYPQYTKPQEFMGLRVPDVLISGNHAKIDEWRRQKSLEITQKRRSDLLKK
ncbi:MAG: tRNA (guanosine(37)-N1)-methyltransferase TrmD [Clostridia bacterium]|nr:tRNA (guanosine(37)-N1)-methyltransferase TrmD [Clostridia bacterium]